MTTFRKAADTLKEAIKDPTNKEKLAAAKKHPKLKKTLAGFTQEDMKVLNKIAQTNPDMGKCT
jgi:hypothetical protein